jgi:hypothetical protein
MEPMVICKVCGYIMAQSQVKEDCPACGVKAKMFIPHDERISEKRKRLLALDIHPILVHFTQAYTGTLLLFSLVVLVVKADWVTPLTTVISVLGYALPLTVIAAFVAGMFDGNVRFRKIRTPLLVKKMILGSVYFVLTCGIFAGVQCHPIPMALISGLSALAMVAASILGFWGVSLLNSRFPG